MGRSFPTPAQKGGWYDYLHCRHEDRGLEGLRVSGLVLSWPGHPERASIGSPGRFVDRQAHWAM